MLPITKRYIDTTPRWEPGGATAEQEDEDQSNPRGTVTAKAPVPHVGEDTDSMRTSTCSARGEVGHIDDAGQATPVMQPVGESTAEPVVPGESWRCPQTCRQGHRSPSRWTGRPPTP